MYLHSYFDTLACYLYLHQIMLKVTEADDIIIQVNIFVGRNVCENYLQHDFHDRFLKAFIIIP